MPSNNAFKEAYKKLNPQQQKAVDTIEGPVLVNAGPGTGKTQILALRIGKILLDTDTSPNSILCLTYTDNGATEMRKRLLEIIGAPAYAINIHTFHSFCNEVIKDNLTFFGKLDLEAVSEVEEINLFNKLIDEIPADNIIKRFRGEVYYEAARLKDLFSLMKKEAWTVDYLEQCIDRYISELPTKENFYYKRKYKDFEAGTPKESAIKEEIKKMEILRAAIHLFPKYNKMMAEISRYNFDDMILWVLSAFEKDNDLLLNYQEKFLYVLVDEFQDTSRSQNLLLQKITGYWSIPNLFVVGDADQSIFSFQDANVQNILDFENKYKINITKIDLVNNYRSTQNILHTAHKLIQKNAIRISLHDEELRSSNTALSQIDTPISVSSYANPSQEAVSTAIKIETLLKGGEIGKEIAVIYRNHGQVAELEAMLRAKNIAVNIRKKTNLLHEPFINSIINLLTWIDKESTISYSADDILFQMLHYNFFSLNPLEIARLSIQLNEKNKKQREDIFSLRRMIAETATSKADLFTPLNPFLQVSNILEDLLKSAANNTVQHLVEMIIQKTGLLAYIMKNDDKQWLFQMLDSFFNFIKDECKRHPDIDLHELLRTIETMKAGNIVLPLYKIFYSEDGINLITAHSSKGSEYRHVFIIGCIESIWDNSKKGNNRTYKLPDNLVSNHILETDLDEGRRLFYVAFTRAKTNLNISYFFKDKNEKDVVCSSFVTEILEEIQEDKKTMTTDEMIPWIALQYSLIAKPEIEIMDNDFINSLLKNYSLSVTHLNNYLECPIKFYYQNLLRVPAAKNGNMVFGSAVHFALQRLFEKMKEQGEVFPQKEEFLNDFFWYMKKNREGFTPEEFKRRNEYGNKILPGYYNHNITKWNKVVSIERNLRNIFVNDVPLNGKLDKLEFTGNLVNVVDYKTGNYKYAKNKMQPPNEKETNGGDYWRQAVFYKILLDNDKTNKWQVVSTAFEFVEPVEDNYLSELITITPEDITTVNQQITETWQNIQAHKFKTGCGKADCIWCNFVKTNNIAIALHEAMEEEQ